MASAAAICGNAAEEAFWEALPSGLARLRTGVSISLVSAFVTMLVSLLLRLNIVCMSGSRLHSREAEAGLHHLFQILKLGHEAVLSPAGPAVGCTNMHTS